MKVQIPQLVPLWECSSAVEQRTFNPSVVGSNPAPPTPNVCHFSYKVARDGFRSCFTFMNVSTVTDSVASISWQCKVSSVAANSRFDSWRQFCRGAGPRRNHFRGSTPRRLAFFLTKTKYNRVEKWPWCWLITTHLEFNSPQLAVYNPERGNIICTIDPPRNPKGGT